MSQTLKINSNPKVNEKFKSYPAHIRPKMKALRKLILESAEELSEVVELEETLKWGEPNYLNKYGSTIRMDWKAKTPEQYAIYFKCTSKLVTTFREVFPEEFQFEKNRAIVFNLDEKVPEKPLKKCIKAALIYHKVKQVENLAIE